MEWERGNEFLRCGRRRLLSAFADKERDYQNDEEEGRGKRKIAGKEGRGKPCPYF